MEIIQGLRPGVFLRHNTYRIEKVLGQGGFGISYLAVDLNLDRYIAIKEFFPKDYCDRDDATSHVTLGTQGSKDFVNRLKAKFLKEARNIARFDNPNIIRIHAAFEENDTAYYVMDYIEGQTLAEIVRNTGPIPEAKALEYINKVGGALEYVHNHKVTHLDVKPANIIIRNADDEPILIDFGLAKQYDAKGNQTSTTPIGISHGYAPMEQYADGGIKVFSPQTDLYSLAATLYYILSGIVPPQATKLIEDELIFPPLIPTRLIVPISKAMSASRKKRHETIGMFLEQLDKLQNDKDDHVGIPIHVESKATAKEEITVGPQTDKTEGSIADDKQLLLTDTDFTVSEEYDSENKSKGIPVWVYAMVAVVAVSVCIYFFFIKNSGNEDSVIETPLPDMRRSFEEALMLLDSDESVTVEEGFVRMRGLAAEYDSARVELGLTFFPYLTAKTREETMNNPILKRRMLLNMQAATDADSVIKYLGMVSDLPPEASYILGCTYYQKNEDEKEALEMFQHAKETLYKGVKPGHGYERNDLGKILINNINALSK